MRRVESLEKTLMLGGIGCRRKRGQQRMRLRKLASFPQAKELADALDEIDERLKAIEE